MADNPLHTEKHPVDVPCDNQRGATPDIEPKDQIDNNKDSKGCTAHTENIAAVVDSTPDGATAEPMQLQTQMEGGSPMAVKSTRSSQESDRVVEIQTESDHAGRCNKGGPMRLTQTRASLATSLVSIKDELGNTADKTPKAGDIAAQHGPSDIEAQECKRLCTVPEGLKEFPVYRALMMATAIISLVLTGYYGAARSSK